MNTKLKSIFPVILIILHLFLISSSTGAQSYIDIVETYNKEVKKAYKSGNFELVDSLALFIINHNILLKRKTFEYWLDACYQIKDLKKAIFCYDYYDINIRKSLSDLMIDKELKDRLIRLKRIDFLMTGVFKEDGSLIIDEKVIGLLKMIIELEPGFWHPYQLSGIVRYDLHQYTEAITACWKTLEIKKDDETALSVLSESYFKTAQYDKTLETLERINIKYELSEHLMEVKSFSQMRIGAYEESINTIKKLIGISPSYVIYYKRLVHSYYITRQYDKMLDPYLKIIELEPLNYENIRYAYNLSVEYTKRDSVLQVINKHLSKKPDDLKYVLFRTKFYSTNDDSHFEKAMIDFNKLIASDTSNAVYYYLKGKYLFFSQNGNNSIREMGKECFKKAISLNPYYYHAYEYLCRYYMWDNSKIARQYKLQAIRHLSEKAWKDTLDGIAFYDLARAFDLDINGYWYKKIFNDSILKYYNLALQYGYDSSVIIPERADIFERLKMYEEAIDDYHWLNERPISAYYKVSNLYDISDCYYNMKEYEKARDIILFIQKEYPDRFIEWKLNRIVEKIE